MVGANELIVMFLGLETVSLALYVLPHLIAVVVQAKNQE